MSAVLYEPVFAIVGKAIADRRRSAACDRHHHRLRRPREHVFLPLTASWCPVSAGATRFCCLPPAWRSPRSPCTGSLSIAKSHDKKCSPVKSCHPVKSSIPSASRQALRGKQAVPSRQALLIAIFTASSVAGAAVSTNLVPALIERKSRRRLQPRSQGLFGIMQLPGRLLFMNTTRTVSPMAILASSLGLQIAGLLVLAAGRRLIPRRFHRRGAVRGWFGPGDPGAAVSRLGVLRSGAGGPHERHVRALATTGARRWSRERRRSRGCRWLRCGVRSAGRGTVGGQRISSHVDNR